MPKPFVAQWFRCRSLPPAIYKRVKTLCAQHSLDERGVVCAGVHALDWLATYQPEVYAQLFVHIAQEEGTRALHPR